MEYPFWRSCINIFNVSAQSFPPDARVPWGWCSWIQAFPASVSLISMQSHTQYINGYDLRISSSFQAKIIMAAMIIINPITKEAWSSHCMLVTHIQPPTPANIPGVLCRKIEIFDNSGHLSPFIGIYPHLTFISVSSRLQECSSWAHHHYKFNRSERL